MKVLLACLLSLFCCASFDTTHAQDSATIFKLLKLEGHRVRWAVPRNGQPLVVTYQLAKDAVEIPGARNCRRITKFDDLAAGSELSDATIRSELEAAFGMWESVAGIHFREAAEGERADILIGAQIEPEGWAFADVFYDTASPEPVKPISKALICFNPLRRWKVGFDGDLNRYDLRYTFAHEIGHTIGLDHPNGGDQVMGYRYEEQFRTLQSGDIRGAVALYGQVRTAALPSPQISDPGAHKSARHAMRRFTKRWGTRAFSERAP